MKTVIKIIFAIFLFTSNLYAQVGINTTTPAGMLDISSTNYGIVMPRIALVSTLQELPVINPKGGSLENGTLVYNTANINDVTSGYYYWEDNEWVSIAKPNEKPIGFNFTTIILPEHENEDVDFDLSSSNYTATVFSTIGPSGEGDNSIDGISGGVHGRVIYILNGDDDDLKIISRNASNSQPENKFSLGGDVILTSGGSLMFIYDGLYLNRWVVVRSDS